jgi:hypothetical protein
MLTSGQVCVHDELQFHRSQLLNPAHLLQVWLDTNGLVGNDGMLSKCSEVPCYPAAPLITACRSRQPSES